MKTSQLGMRRFLPPSGISVRLHDVGNKRRERENLCCRRQGKCFGRGRIPGEAPPPCVYACGIQPLDYSYDGSLKPRKGAYAARLLDFDVNRAGMIVLLTAANGASDPGRPNRGKRLSANVNTLIDTRARATLPMGVSTFVGRELAKPFRVKSANLQEADEEEFTNVSVRHRRAM